MTNWFPVELWTHASGILSKVIGEFGLPAILALVGLQLLFLRLAHVYRSSSKGQIFEQRMSELEQKLNNVDAGNSRSSPSGSKEDEASTARKLNEVHAELRMMREEAIRANRKADRMTNLSMALGIVSLILSVVLFIYQYYVPPG
jgi:hypothetical protein